MPDDYCPHSKRFICTTFNEGIPACVEKRSTYYCYKYKTAQTTFLNKAGYSEDRNKNISSLKYYLRRLGRT